MTRGSRRLVYFAVAVVAILAIIGAASYFFRPTGSARSAEVMAGNFADADREIAAGAFERARAPITRAAGYAHDRLSWLAVLKRAYAISQGGGDFEFLRTISLRASASLPGSQEIRVFEAVADTRTSRFSEAIAISDRYLTDPSYGSFKTEAVLRGYPTIDARSVNLDPENRAYLEAMTSKDPQLFQNLAQETGNEDFLFDASLLRAYSGDLPGAYRLLITMHSAVKPEVGMLMSYDAGELDAARNWYDSLGPDARTEGLTLLSGDIDMAEGALADAKKSYEQAVARDPSYSWVPYVNLAWISDQAGDQREAAQLQAGYVAFPKQREVVLSLADLYRRTFQPDRALGVLTPFLASSPWDLDANLMSLRISGASGNPERFKSRLWELFYHAESGSPVERSRIARYLGWYLFGLHDYEGIDLVLRQLSGDEGEEWYQFYRGMRASADDNVVEGLARFRSALAIADRWETRYNVGLLQMESGDYDSAVDSFEKADLLFQETAAVIQSPTRAQIHVELAYALDGAGKTEAAKREVVYALDIDHANLKGNLLLQKLDSVGQK